MEIENDNSNEQVFTLEGLKEWLTTNKISNEKDEEFNLLCFKVEKFIKYESFIEPAEIAVTDLRNINVTNETELLKWCRMHKKLGDEMFEFEVSFFLWDNDIKKGRIEVSDDFYCESKPFLKMIFLADIFAILNAAPSFSNDIVLELQLFINRYFNELINLGKGKGMDILPFIHRNGLWYLHMPELRESHETGFASLAMAENGIFELLVALATKYKYKYKIKDKLVLGFSEAPIENYDARLDRMKIEISEDYLNYPGEVSNIGRAYYCTELFGSKKMNRIWLSPMLLKCLNSVNPVSIYISVLKSESQGEN